MKVEFKHRLADLETPEKLDENLYRPVLNTVKTESLDVINGHLDHDNVAYSSSETRHLPLPAIRRGAMFRGKMVGSTLNADFAKDIVDYTNASSSASSDGDKLQPIPGTGIEFYAPSDGILLLTWQLSYSSDLDTPKKGSSSKYQQRAFLSLMGAQGSTLDLEELGFRQYLPACIDPDGAPPTGGPGTGDAVGRYLGMGRMWSGHHVVGVTSQTWYRYGIGVYSTANLTRIRVRNFKYLYFPNLSGGIRNTLSSGL